MLLRYINISVRCCQDISTYQCQDISTYLVWVTSTPPIRQKPNCTSWCYSNQIFDCIMAFIIWVHLCSSQLWFCGRLINISMQSVIHTQLLRLLKLDGNFFLTASLSGHTIRFFNKTDRGFIHFQKFFDTFASLRLNWIAKSQFIKPSFSFIKTRNKWFSYPKCWTMRLMLGLITSSNHVNNCEFAALIRNCKSLSLVFSYEKIFSLWCFNSLIWAFFSLNCFFNKCIFLSFYFESVCLITSSVWVSLSAAISNLFVWHNLVLNAHPLHLHKVLLHWSWERLFFLFFWPGF